MSKSYGKKLIRSAVVALLVVASTTLATTAFAATKQFSLTLTPGSAAAGATQTYSATITNESGGTLDSVTITSPTGFTPGSRTLTALGLGNGASTTRTFTAATPCVAGGSSYAWSATGRATNNQSYALDPATSSVGGSTSGNCTLAFTGQPANAQANTIISTVAYDTSAASVAVQVNDANGAATSQSDGATVTLTQSSNTNALSGNSATLSGGAATFPALKDSKASVGYTLTAAVSGNSSITDPLPSQSFQIWDKREKCNANSPCSNLYTPSGGDLTTEADTTFDVDAGIVISYDVQSSLCSSDSYNHLPNVVTVDSDTQGQLPSGDWLITLRVSKQFDQLQPRNGASFYHPCLATKVPFTTLDGSPAQLSTDGLYYGTMQDAPHCSAPSPCVLSKNKTKSGQVILVLQLPANDPRTW